MAKGQEFRKFFVVFKREYLERVRSKWFLVATVVGPLFFLGISVLGPIMAMKTKGSSNLTNIAILDATGTPLGQRVAASLAAGRAGAAAPDLRTVEPARLAQAESLATQEVVREQKLGYLVLDGSTVGGRSYRYAGRNASTIVDMEAIERTVQQTLLAMRLEREGIDPGRVASLTAVKLKRETTKISDKGREQAGGASSIIFANVIFFLLYFMIAIYGQAVMRGVLEEKTTRVAEVVVSSARPSTLLAGKVLGVGAVALTQVVAWIALVALFYQNREAIFARFGAAGAGAMRLPAVAPEVAVSLVLFFILGFVLYCALYAAVAAMVSSQEDLNQAQWPVSMLLIASVVMWQPIMLNPMSGLAKVMSYLPFSAPIIMPMRMALVAVPWTEILGSLLSVALGVALVIWLSSRIYRVGLLMYGKRPSFAEVAKWVRYG